MGCGWAGKGEAKTLFEIQMGMIDRGAELDWLSQYPHEREVLIPPLTGLEKMSSEVQGEMLAMQARLSLNLSAQTLEQVLSRRRKMIMDMAKGIEFELREILGDTPLLRTAIQILRKALEYGAFRKSPEWFNDDDNFSQVLNETLYLQRMLVTEIKRMDKAFDQSELDLGNWKVRGPGRVVLLAGFILARTNTSDVFINLRNTELTPHDGKQLAELLRDVPKLTAVDVRSNEKLGEEGSAALVEFMKTSKKNSMSVARSLMGVHPAHSSLDVPKHIPVYETRMLCAELETNAFTEGVSAAMGETSNKGKGAVSTLNRRNGAGGNWQPLLWAAKANQQVVALRLLALGHDVNQTEPLSDKGANAWSPIHWASSKGHLNMVQLLLEHGADPLKLDKHATKARTIAEKKAFKEIAAILEEAEENVAKGVSNKKENKSKGGGGGSRKSKEMLAGLLTMAMGKAKADEAAGTAGAAPAAAPDSVEA
jgi:hypothetical protein